MNRRPAVSRYTVNKIGKNLQDLYDFGTLFAKARVAFAAQTKKAGMNAGLFRAFVQTWINTGRGPSCPS
jgi:hypothetical protein